MGFAPSQNFIPALPYIGCRVRHNVAQSIPNLVETALAFNETDRDVGGYHNNLVNNTRVTIPSGGDGNYKFVGTCLFAPSVLGRIRTIRLRKNGVTNFGLGTSPPVVSTFFGTAVMIVTELDMIGGDYAQLFVLQDTGLALDVMSAGVESPVFICRKGGVI